MLDNWAPGFLGGWSQETEPICILYRSNISSVGLRSLVLEKILLDPLVVRQRSMTTCQSLGQNKTLAGSLNLR
jgi:hypothetical protein